MAKKKQFKKKKRKKLSWIKEFILNCKIVSKHVSTYLFQEILVNHTFSKFKKLNIPKIQKLH